VDVKIGVTGRFQLDAIDQRQLRSREKILEVWSEPPSRDHLQVFASLPVGLGGATVVDAAGMCFIRLSALAQVI
jgi:hypothetical protein